MFQTLAGAAARGGVQPAVRVAAPHYHRRATPTNGAGERGAALV
ncbi:MAG: hypothetical protein WCK70_03635 [Chloroflexales bacterium]